MEPSSAVNISNYTISGTFFAVMIATAHFRPHNWKGKMRKMKLIHRFSLLCLFAVLFFGTIFGWITGIYFERIMLLWEKRVTANIIAENVRSHFDIGTFSTPKMGMDYENLSGELEHIILGAGIERIKVWNREMVITWADDRRLVGKQFSDNDELSKALDGQIMSEITETKHAENELEKQFTVLHELYVPIKSGDSGNIETVFEIYQNLDSSMPISWDTKKSSGLQRSSDFLSSI